MLKSIKLVNFRKHTDSVFTFDDGLSIMRGANEAGKSTILEAVAYALFGVKALRSPLAEAVTWGEPENSLKVVLEMRIDNTDYIVSRGKAGAEANYDGGKVTGQTEVTNFIADKLKVDSNSAAKLMLSTQMDIRGALEAGPKATTELIERLAEFDQIDHLIDIMQEKLTLGNNSVAAAAVEAAQARVDARQEIVEPNVPALQKSISNAKSTVELAQAEFNKLRDADRAAQAANVAGQAAHREHVRLQSKRNVVRGQMSNMELEIESHGLNEAPVVENADERIQAALQAKSQLAQASTVRRAYNEVKDLLGRQDIEYFDGDAAVLAKAIQDLQNLRAEATSSIGKCNVEVAKLQGKLLLNSCTFCGKDFSEVPEVQAKNAALQAQIDELLAAGQASDARLKQATDGIAKLEKFTKFAGIIDATLKKYGQYLHTDTNTVPPILAWNPNFVVIPAEEAVPDYDGEIERIKYAVRLRTQWERKCQEITDTAARLRTEFSEVEAAIAILPSVDLNALADAEQAARRAANDAQETLDDVRRTLTMAENRLREETQRWERESKNSADAQQALEVAKANLKALDFNNALLKKVRTARPMIADKLWNLVLAAVSKYFSEMRGTRSLVTKTSDGFLVDGKPVGVLSGSTLDILGLAIRVALVRTFLPQAPFLVLDEPCASMDEERTQALLGFLVAVGFKQTLVVTHENVSESVADHIIKLGE